MELPGPKVRTGPLADGPQVVKLRPERDLRGVAIKPAVASLVAGFPADTHPPGLGTRLPPTVSLAPTGRSQLARRPV